MAVRLPLFIQDKESIRQWDEDIKDDVHRRLAYSYAADPNITLSVVSSAGNISPNMSDTRYKSGAAKRNTSGNWPQVTTFPTESQTEEPQLVTTTYDKITQTRTDPGGHLSYYDWQAKPVYYEDRPSGGYAVREMGWLDFIDTFIGPVVTNIIYENTDTLAGGTYFISTSSSISNCTNLGTIFVDTKADVPAYTAAQIGTEGTYQTHSTTVNTYRLFRNNGEEKDFRLPLVIDRESNGINAAPTGLREMTQTEFSQLMLPILKQQVYDGAGNTLNFSIDGDGVTKGSAINNTVLTGVTGNYQTRKATANDYRAQEFPNGNITTANTWRLKLNRT